MCVVLVAEAAGEWQARFDAAGWAGRLITVEVAEETVELADPVIEIVRALGDTPPEVIAVIGVGPGGRAAQLFAVAGRARALVLIDGLPHGFAEPSEVIAERLAWMRLRVAGEHPPIPRVEGRSFAIRIAAAVTVPTLAVETRESKTPADLADAVVGACPSAVLARVGDRDEAAARVCAWMSS